MPGLPATFRDAAIEPGSNQPAFHEQGVTVEQVSPGRAYGRAVIEPGEFDLPESFRTGIRTLVQGKALHRHKRLPWPLRRFRLAGLRRHLGHPAAQRLIQADLTLEIIRPGLLVSIQVIVITALGIQQGQVVDPARDIHLVADLPGEVGSLDAFLQCDQTPRGLVNRGQGALDLLHGLEDGAGITFHHFLLDRLRKYLFVLFPAAIEDAERHAVHDIPEQSTGQKQLRQGNAAVAGLGRQIDGGQKARPSYRQVGIGREQLRLRHAQIGPTQQQGGGQAG